MSLSCLVSGRLKDRILGSFKRSFWSFEGPSSLKIWCFGYQIHVLKLHMISNLSLKLIFFSPFSLCSTSITAERKSQQGIVWWASNQQKRVRTTGDRMQSWTRPRYR